MADSEQIMDALDNRVRRRDERRDFFKAALGAAAVGAGAFAFATPAAAQAPTDPDILNFALQLEYLEAQFYLFAANGVGLPENQLTGTGTRGNVQVAAGQPGQPRRIAFSDPVISEYAQEIAADEERHVNFLRTALGTAAVAQPAINISGGMNGPFTAAARAAGVVGANEMFDPYANDDNFLLGAFIFEDVGVTAYKGASPLIRNPTFLQAAAGILAVEAYHAAIVRTVLYQRGAQTGSTVYQTVERISTARATLDRRNPRGDQGIAPVQTQVNTINGQQTVAVSNIVPTDTNAIAFSRSPQEVLRIVYLNSASATMGGFFPAGLNGNIRATV